MLCNGSQFGGILKYLCLFQSVPFVQNEEEIASVGENFNFHLKMSELKTEDKVLLVKFYFQSGESVTSAIRYFCTTKCIKRKERKTSFNTVKRIINTFLDTGSVHVKKTNSKRRSQDDIDTVSQIVEENPLSSCRSIAASSDMSKTKVHLILKRELELFPYKSQDERLLTDRARAERLSFCQNFLEKAEDSNFLKNVLFTDEAIFDMNPIINKQNCRHWSKVKPSPVAFKTSFPAKQMVWIGFTKSFIIGPYFFSKNVNADSYCEMIESFVLPKLKENRKLSHTIFQQDGARPHTANKTLDLLHDSFPAGIITRGSEFCWPAYSPD